MQNNNVFRNRCQHPRGYLPISSFWAFMRSASCNLLLVGKEQVMQEVRVRYRQLARNSMAGITWYHGRCDSRNREIIRISHDIYLRPRSAASKAEVISRYPLPGARARTAQGYLIYPYSIVSVSTLALRFFAVKTCQTNNMQDRIFGIFGFSLSPISYYLSTPSSLLHALHALDIPSHGNLVYFLTRVELTLKSPELVRILVSSSLFRDLSSLS